MSERQDELRALMREHSLTYPAVAGLASVSVKTVEGWLAGPDAKRPPRAISRTHLDLIKLRLERREKGTR